MNFSRSFKVVFSSIFSLFQEGFTAFLLMMAVCSLIALPGCNTIKGVGEDISGSASFVQHKMDGDSYNGSRSTSSTTVEGVNPPQWPASSGSVD